MIGFSLSDEQRVFQELAHKFAVDFIRPAAARCDEMEEMDWSIYGKAHELGLTNFYIPEEYGGSGIRDYVSQALICEELSWGCTGIAANFLGAMGVVHALLGAGTEAQKAKYLPALAGPSCRASVAMTEPGAGSDAAAIKTRARRLDNGSYMLNGTKSFITNAGVADVILLFATLDPAKRAKSITAFLLDRDTPGLKIGRKERKMGQRAAGSWELFLDDACVPAEARLGGEGEGFYIAARTFVNFRPVVAARAVGIGRAAFEYARDYAKQRHTFGRPIIEHQGIAFKLADLATRLEAARLLVWAAADAANRGEDIVSRASMAKLYATDTAMYVTTEAVQILGSYGYSRESPVEKWMRDAKGQQILEGPNEIQRLLIARNM